MRNDIGEEWYLGRLWHVILRGVKSEGNRGEIPQRNVGVCPGECKVGRESFWACVETSLERLTFRVVGTPGECRVEAAVHHFRKTMISERKPLSLKMSSSLLHASFQITPDSCLAETLQENQPPLADGKVEDPEEVCCLANCTPKLQGK